MPEPSRCLAEQLRNVRVCVRPELDVSRHVFGGEAAYVVRDPISFHSHRLSKADYRVFTAISASQTLGRVFDKLVEADALDQSQEEQFYQFIVSLTQRGLLNLPISDGGRLYERYEGRQHAKRKGRLMKSLFFRVPLMQPDRFLERTADFVKPLFTRAAFLIWSVCVLAALAVVLSRWDEATSPLSSILTVGNLPMLWTLLVVLKVVHEFGHAYACKKYGGDVPEMGAYFILFTPCAYIDASSSWGFPDRWQRIVVALAGMYFESIAAMCALLIWVLTPPGAVHDAAHYAVVLSTIVTIAFNINPLMRYDGYYVLSDVVGMPNLRKVSEGKVREALTCLLYGVCSPKPSRARFRDVGLIAFGVAASVYKVMLVFAIGLLIAQKVPLLGIAVAATFVLQSLRRSFVSLLDYLRFSKELDGRRQRAVFVTASCAAATVFVIGVIPLPGGVEALAVATPSAEITVRAESPGFVRETYIQSGDRVWAGRRLCRLENIDVAAEVNRLNVETKALEKSWKRALFEDRHAVAQSAAQLAHARQDQTTAAEDLEALEVCAAREGFVTIVHADRIGAYLRKGDAVATLGSGPWTLRALLTSEQLVNANLNSGDVVRYRLIGRPSKILSGRILKVSPQGQKKVERAELTHLAGGEIAVDPSSSEAAAPLYEITIAIAETSPLALRTGSTAQVRFSGERRTLLTYLYRRGLQLFNDLRTVG